MNSAQLPMFVESLCDAFKNMLGVELRAGEIQEASEPVKADLSACVSVQGASPALLVIGFDEQSAVEAAARFVQMPCAFEDPMVSDAAREILNISVGGAQKRVTEKFSFSLPLSAQGINHEINSFRKGRILGTKLSWGEKFSVSLFMNLPG